MSTSESPGFVIHGRRFRENSRIIEVFTRDAGRVSLVARVSSKPGKAGAAQLQPFRRLLLRWRGQRELKNLHSFEPLVLVPLSGEAGICGLYCNEILLHLLPAGLPFPDLFHVYEKTLENMAAGEPLGAVLRVFEWHLLDELGYAADVEEDCLTGAPLASAQQYFFLPGRGFSHRPPGQNAVALSAEAMLALREGRLDDPRYQREFRAVNTAAIRDLLGGRELKSRKLMRQLTHYRKEQQTP